MSTTQTPLLSPAALPEIRNLDWVQEGIAMHAYLDHPDAKLLYGALAAFQDEFLKTDHAWRGELPWPPDALGWWSRRWEYVYAMLRGKPQAGQRVLDAGSGITFFPYLLRTMGLQVTCCDLDERLAAAFNTANRMVGLEVGFAAADLARLPFETGEFDTVFCISVLEHTGNWERIIREFHRVIRPGGTLLLTFDVALSNPNEAYAIPGCRQLLKDLRTCFDYQPITLPDEFPADALTNRSTFLRKNDLTFEQVAGTGPRGLKETLERLRHPRRYAWAREQVLGMPDLGCVCLTAKRKD